MEFNSAFVTDIGRKRQKNQDNGGAFDDLGLFVVADGMGGHKGGEVASAHVLRVLPDYVRQANGQAFDPRQVVDEGIRRSNNAIFEQSQKEPELSGMGTTTTALIFRNGRLTVGHVGDSRCYYFRPGMIWQVTRDHSLVQEKLKAGLITRAQLETDSMKNVITRSVGFESDVNVEVYEMPVNPGDLFLICSDGLSGLVNDAGMLEIVQREFYEKGDLKKAAKALVDQANENGGDDNITVVMAQVTKN